MIIRATGALLSPPERQEGERQAPTLALGSPIGPFLDMGRMMPTFIWDQGPEGTCTMHAQAALLWFLFAGWEASRRDGYWQARHLLGMLDGPPGAHQAAVMKCGQRFGYLSAVVAPYVPGNWEWLPPSDADELRKAHHLGSFWRVGLLADELRAKLWANGPVVAVVETDDAFDEAPGGEVDAPRGEAQGLHAIVIEGYDAATNRFLVRNSWGPGWGKGGRAWVSWAWLAVRLREAWQASKGTGDPAPRPLWEMLWPQLTMYATDPASSPSLA